MASIHFIGGEKGGVGKSVVARLLAQYMIDHNIPFIGYDTDRSHSSFTRHYSGYASPTIIDNYQSLDSMVEFAAENPEQQVLVDLAAQTHHPLAKWMDESGVLELAEELGINIYYWNVMDSGKDCVDLLGKLLEQYGQRLNYILVLNQLRDDSFSILENSGFKERALALGARVVNLKRLHAPAMTKIDGNNYSFWAATTKDVNTDNALSILERQRIKIWLNSFYKEVEGLGICSKA